MAKHLIEITNLCKIYPDGKQANDSIDMVIFPGEIVGIVGPNGAGKTTLLRQLLGLLRPSSGRILIDGTNIEENIDCIRNTISYVPQAPIYYPALTIRETLEFVLRLDGLDSSSVKQRISETLESLNIDEFADKPGYQLSDGLHKIALLAIGISKPSKVIVMDEPTAMVDILRKSHFWSVMKQLSASGRSILLASHDISEIKAVCDRVYVLVDGRLTHLGGLTTHARKMELPVEIEIVPVSAATCHDFLRQGSYKWQEDGTNIKLEFLTLMDASSFLYDFSKSVEVEKITVNAPSLDTAIRQMLESKI